MRTKAKITVTGLIVLCLCLSVMCIGLSGRQAAQAATIRETSYADNFDAAELNEERWAKSDDVTHGKEYAALRLQGMSWQQQVTLQSFGLNSDWDDFTVSFDADWLNGSAGWMGIFLANALPGSWFTSAKYFMHWRADASAQYTEKYEYSGKGIRITPNRTGSAFPNEDQFDPDIAQFIPTPGTDTPWEAGDLSKNGEVLNVELHFERAQTESAAEGDDTEPKKAGHVLTLKWKKQSASDWTSYTFDQMELDVQGYIGFTSNGNHIVEIRNFAVTVAGEEEPRFADDFSEGSISFPSLPDPLATWRCVGATENNAYCGNICTVNFNGAPNGKLVYLNELKENPYNTFGFEMTYNVQYVTLTDETYIGNGFGMASATAAVDSNGYVGVIQSGNTLVPTLLKNGEVVKTADPVAQPTGVDFDLTFVGTAGGDITLKIDGKTAAVFEGVGFDGYTAIAARSLDPETTGNNMKVDDFSLTESITLFAENEDYRIDFKGRQERTTASGGKAKDFWFNTRNWTQYGSASTPNLTMDQNRNYIMLEGTREEGGFAPKAEFGDFIARFSFSTSWIDPENTLSPVGLSFGRETVSGSASGAPGVYFQPVTDKDGNITSARVIGNRIATASGGTAVALSADKNVFAEVNEWWTCMVVASNGVVDVYLCKADETAFGAPVATFTNVYAHGYVAVTHLPSGSSYANYRFTDFSVMGTDLLQSADAPARNSNKERAIGDFAGGEQDGWTTENVTMSSRGAQLLGAGKLTSKAAMGDFMAQIQIDALGGGFTVSFGNASIRIDGARLTLTGLVNEMGDNVTYLDESIRAGATLKVQSVGGRVTLAVKQSNEPYDKLGSVAVTMRYAENTTPASANIVLSTGADDMLGVRAAYAYSLNKAVEIVTENYTAPVEETPAPEDKGCGSVLGSASVLTASVLLLAAAVIVMERRKHEKNI